ncbi:type I toxin-antitoxin system Fst family toxin [Staphylococcus caprae]
MLKIFVHITTSVIIACIIALFTHWHVIAIINRRL